MGTRDRSFELWFAVVALVGLGFFAGIVYVAIHFLAKVW